MITAHIAGIPVEEWAGPLLVSGGGLVVAVGAAVSRLFPRQRAPREARAPQ